MLSVLLAALLATSPGPADAARAELEQVAERIARLKERRLAGEPVGDELTRLLVRAQELAAEIERASPQHRPAAAPGVPPEELRERADALRDEADRVLAQIEEIDRALEEVDRERRREAALEALAGDSALFGDSDLGGRRAPRTSPSATSASAASVSDPPRTTSSSRTDARVDERSQPQPAGPTRDEPALPAEGAAAEVRMLQTQRAALAERLAALKAEAEKLDAAAKRAAEE